MEKKENNSMLDDPLYHNLLDGSRNDVLFTGRRQKRHLCGIKGCRRHACCKLFLVIGMIFFIGLGMAVYFTTYVENGIQSVVLQQLPLAQESQRAFDWAKGQPPLTYRIYVFNLTNPNDFLNGARPRLVEVGPFEYKVTETKEEVVFNGSTVTFRSKPVFVFQENVSVEGGEDLKIFTLNIPLVNAGEITRGPALQKAFSVIREVYSFDSVKHLTVREILWGHKSRVLDFAKTLKDLPYPYDYFALLAGRNNTLQPLTTINTGVDDVYKTSEFLSYDGPGPKTGCNAYRGTDGSGFGPNVNTSQVLFVYNGQFCRSLPLVYQKTIHEQGLTAYRFLMPHDVFTYSEIPRQYSWQNASFHSNKLLGNTRYGLFNADIVTKSSLDTSKRTDKPPSWKDVYGGSNNCFCNKGRCPPDGILDMKPCLYGAAVGFSFPHLLNADPALRYMVHGMRPDPSKHSTEFDIFPALGIPIRVKLRMQMNVVLDRNHALNRARQFDLIYPVFWFEAGIDNLPPNLAEKLQMVQDVPSMAKNMVLWICGILTAMLFFALLVLVILNYRSTDIESLSSLGSKQDSGSNSSDSKGDHYSQGGRDASAPVISEVGVLMNNGTYASFERSHSIVTDDIPVLITDYGTLLPPYTLPKEREQEGNRVSDGDDNLGSVLQDSEVENSDGTQRAAIDYTNHEDEEAGNEYPPSYEIAALPDIYTSPLGSNSSSVSVSADVHHSASYVDVRPLGKSSSNVTSEPKTPETRTQSPADFPIVYASPHEVNVSQKTDTKPVVINVEPKENGKTLKNTETSSPKEITPHSSPGEVNISDIPIGDADEEDGRDKEAPQATSSPHGTAEEIQPSHFTGEDTWQQPGWESSLSCERLPSPNQGSDNDAENELLLWKDPSSVLPSRTSKDPPRTIAPLESDL